MDDENRTDSMRIGVAAAAAAAGSGLPTAAAGNHVPTTAAAGDGAAGDGAVSDGIEQTSDLYTDYTVLVGAVFVWFIN